MNRPELTFPKPESEFILDAYRSSCSILEYGSGGSTVLASEMQLKQILSVESDKKWAGDLQAYIQGSPLTKSVPHILSVDIGQTTHWGWPATNAKFSNYHLYSLSPWLHIYSSDTSSTNPQNIHPDVILVDGRFRLACFFVSCLLCKKETTLLFDDYVERPHYLVAEKLFSPHKLVGRMAIFKIRPGEFTAEQINLLFSSLTNPH